MANKEALRELQSRLAERLQAARARTGAQPVAGRRMAGRGFLLPLREAGEIFAHTTIVPVPHASPGSWAWPTCAGLHGVVDLAAFLGVSGAEAASDAAGPAGRRSTARWKSTARCWSTGSPACAAKPAHAPSRTTVRPRPPFVGGRFRDVPGAAVAGTDLAALPWRPEVLKIVG